MYLIQAFFFFFNVFRAQLCHQLANGHTQNKYQGLYFNRKKHLLWDLVLMLTLFSDILYATLLALDLF